MYIFGKYGSGRRSEKWYVLYISDRLTQDEARKTLPINEYLQESEKINKVYQSESSGFTSLDRTKLPTFHRPLGINSPVVERVKSSKLLFNFLQQPKMAPPHKLNFPESKLSHSFPDMSMIRDGAPRTNPVL